MTGEQPLTFGYSYNSNGTLATKTYPQSVTINYVYDRGHCIATKRDSINICLTTLDSGNMTVRYVGGKLMYGNPRLAPIDHGGIIFNSGGTALPMGGDPYTPQDFGDPIPDFPTDDLSVSTILYTLPFIIFIFGIFVPSKFLIVVPSSKKLTIYINSTSIFIISY